VLRFLKGYLAAGQIAAAAIVANVVALCVAPFITRLYSPGDFGGYSTFIALTFIDVVACLGYDKAVVAVRDDETSHRLASLSVVCALVVGGLAATFALAWLWLVTLKPQGFGVIVLLLPISVALVGILNAIYSTCIRELRFSVVAASRIMQALATAAIQLSSASLVLFGAPAGLILGQVFGTAAAVGVALFARARRAPMPLLMAPHGLFALAREHSSYVSAVVPGLLFNSLTLQAPILLVGAMYDSTTIGLFGLTQRIASAPMALLGIAVGQVFAGRFSQLLRGGAGVHEAKVFYLRTAAMMLPIAVVLSIVAVPAPWLFGLVFGAEWEPAGYVYRSLLPLFCMQVMVGPLQSVFYLVGRHDLYWKSEAARLTMVLCAFGLAAAFGLGASVTFTILGVIGAAAYVVSALLAVHALSHARLEVKAGGESA